MSDPQSGMEMLKYRIDRAEAEAREVREELRNENREMRAVLMNEIKALHDELDKRATEEKARLVWGISVLGGAVLTLATVIWNWRSVIFRGTP